jgi:hypothetical protein
MKTYKLYQVSLWSLLKIGFLVGWIGSFLPVAVLFFFFFKMISALTGWLSGLVYELRLPLPGNFGIELNLIEILKLQGLLDWLQTWDAIGFIPAILLVLFITSLAALFWGLVVAAVGLVFNLISKASGGVEITLAEQNSKDGSLV